MISYKSFLMVKNGESWEKLIDIKDFPDLFGTPEMLEKTTLSNRSRVYEPGIEETEALEFTANYDYDKFLELRGMKGEEKEFAVWFGGTETADSVTPTGTDGKFKCNGKLSVGIVGKGVNEIQEMRITIVPTTDLMVDED